MHIDINEYLMIQRDRGDPMPKAKRIECADGFSISVQANRFAYCSPRTNLGPWAKVECGYPSDVPSEIMDYAKCPETPTETFYSYVPVKLVEELIAAHGGMKPRPQSGE